MILIYFHWIKLNSEIKSIIWMLQIIFFFYNLKRFVNTNFLIHLWTFYFETKCIVWTFYLSDSRKMYLYSILVWLPTLCFEGFKNTSRIGLSHSNYRISPLNLISHRNNQGSFILTNFGRSKSERDLNSSLSTYLYLGLIF